MIQTLNILRGQLCLLLCLGLFAACSSDDDVQEQPKKTYPLTIEVEENPLIPEGVRSVGTRAAITYTSDLTEFYMSYVYGETPSTGSITATKDGEGKWENSTGKDKGWPDATATINWYAYTCKESTPGTFYANSGNPYIDFKVEEAAANQHDLLVATALNKTWSNCSGHLLFTFDHACSALCFYVKKATNLNDYTLSVSRIVLKNVVKHGQYFYDIGNGTGGWTPITGDSENDITDYTLYSGSGITLGSATTDYVALNGNFGTAENPYLFVIPQTLTAWDHATAITSTTQSYLEIVCTITNTSTSNVVYSGTAYIPFAATFLQGVQHDVNINIGKNTLYKYNESTHTYINIIN